MHFVALISSFLVFINVCSVNATPNFLIFFIDDISYTSDWSDFAPGQELKDETITSLDIPLPNIQKIIDEGITFKRTYCGGPKCAPSRFALLTGRQVVRSEFGVSRTLATSSGYAGTNVSIQTAKITLNDAIYNIPYQLSHDVNNAYLTGMVGKWHLMTSGDDGYHYGCSSLTYTPNETLYNLCTDIVKQQGFDFVDAFYISNIDGDEHYSHNPEWMVYESQNFINQSIEENKPFFLYFASTLTHTPFAYNALFNFTTQDTPKGTIQKIRNSEIGMKTRANIYQQALDLGFTQNKRISDAALALWMDDSLGALITFLEDNGLYNDTFIVVMNDHGMGAKGFLYEQGARIIQFIRYPPLFGIDGYVFDDDFIVSNIDLASIIFELAEIEIDSNYVLDSTNWINDVLEVINDDNSDDDANCCEYRFVDMYNSHALITSEWKYIFRATKEVEGDGSGCDLYEYCYDDEQLYHLITDPGEQFNQINNDSLKQIISELQTKMIEYVQNIACPIDSCKVPTIDGGSNVSTTSTSTSSHNDNGSESITGIIVVVSFILLVIGDF